MLRNKPLAYSCLLILFLGLMLIGAGRKWSETYQRAYGPRQEALVYYGNFELDPELSCDKVFPVRRTVYGSGVESVILTLLEGPTKEERKAGYFMSNDEEIRIDNVRVWRGTAYVEFDKDSSPPTAGLCQSIARNAEIEQTLLQFPEIKHVRFTRNGEDITERMLEPAAISYP